MRRLLLCCLVLAACRAKPLTERIVGTYTDHDVTAATATIAIHAGGRLTFTERDRSDARLIDGTYSVVGDTVYFMLPTVLPGKAQPGVLHGDTLVLLSIQGDVVRRMPRQQ